jgi:hypothetical protein
MTDPLRTTTPTTPPGPTASSGTTDEAKARAGAAADTVKQAGSDVAGTAADKAKNVAEETKQQARDFVGEARSTVTQQAGQQHQNLVKNLRSLGDEFSSMSGSNGQGGLGGELVGRAGDHAHRVAEWMDARQPDQLVEEVRTFARRRPGVFLAGALIAGVAVGRLTRGVVDTHRDGSDDGSSTPAEYPAAPSDPTVAMPAATGDYGTAAPTMEPAGPTTAYLPPPEQALGPRTEPTYPPTVGPGTTPPPTPGTGFPNQGGL